MTLFLKDSANRTLAFKLDGDRYWSDPHGGDFSGEEQIDMNIVASAFGEVVSKYDLHSCSCGRVYTMHEWKLLHLIGLMVDEVESIELRNCKVCKSTIAKVKEVSRDEG